MPGTWTCAAISIILIYLDDQNREVLHGMITAMAADYRSIYYADLDKDECQCVRAAETPYSDITEGSRFPFLEKFTEYAHHRVAEADREGFLRFINPENIRAGLSREAMLSHRYLTRTENGEQYEMLRIAGVRTIEERSDHTVHGIGVGMDKDFLPRLFDPFSQEDATSTNRFGGSGLGMAITKNMVDLMGGSIAVESEKGRGSRFTVEIPLRRAQHTGEPEAAEADLPSVSVAGRHVLIAEDLELNAEVLIDLLEMEDVSSEWAENGQLALERFEQSEAGHFDAILMDMRMPVMDGLAATRAIRALPRPDAETIPILALTANAFEEDVKQCLQAGMDAHLAKPVDIDRLTALLGRLLAERE